MDSRYYITELGREVLSHGFYEKDFRNTRDPGFDFAVLNHINRNPGGSLNSIRGWLEEYYSKYWSNRIDSYLTDLEFLGYIEDRS